MPAAVGRLGRAFAAAPGATGLIPFITVGYPSLDASLEMLRGFSRLGARAVEIGIPFSDPIADGPEIQRASEWALGHGVGARQALELAAALRRESELPVVLMTYANPVLRMGIRSFATGAHAAGADAIILSDLPPDEPPEAGQGAGGPHGARGSAPRFGSEPVSPPERPVMPVRARQ